MKLNPITNALYTDSGELLKVLHCPRQMSWDALPADGSDSRMCHSCARPVHDTSRLTDEEVAGILTRNPGACLMVSLHHQNCTLLPHEFDFVEMETHDPPPANRLE